MFALDWIACIDVDDILVLLLLTVWIQCGQYDSNVDVFQEVGNEISNLAENENS